MNKFKKRSIDQDVFICLDCETTGLDPENDRIIEIAAVKFTMKKFLERTETLINPEVPISEESMKIHHITEEMVSGKPILKQVLPEFLQFVGDHIIVGHGICFDINIIHHSAERLGIPCNIEKNKFIDTLRIARLYGESPSNSLEVLREHFNIEYEGPHRAMNDVVVNIEVFRQLTKDFLSTKELMKVLQKPIALKHMPLGPHKGRLIKEVPQEYLRWAANKNFDQDLLFTIRSELKKRKTTKRFGQATNPFQDLDL